MNRKYVPAALMKDTWDLCRKAQLGQNESRIQQCC